MTATTDEICPPGTPFARAVDSVRRGDASPVDAARELVTHLNDDELLGVLDGDVHPRELLGLFRSGEGTPIFVAGHVERLGIPGIRFTDGPRGVTNGRCTAFPVAIARAATWDTALEREVAEAIGAEARVRGANLFGGICVNLPYAPGWGRTQETYGEDPILLGAMGAASVEGVRPWVLSCVKHFACNSMEEARFRVDVEVDEDALREVFLPHFRAVVEAGVDAVMSAYNRVNGVWCGEHRHLLTEVLRDDWGFEGFVMTDFIWGLHDPVGSVAAGQDLEMPLRQQRAATLPEALRDGRLDRPDAVRAATRIIARQIDLAVRARSTPDPDVVAGHAHRALARRAASRGTVLLRNGTVDDRPALPLDAESVGTVAVLGRLADRANQGDVGSSRVEAPSSVSILAGLRERLGERVVHVEDGDLDAAIDAARSADAALVVVGFDSSDEGESLLGLDADSISLFGGPARLRPVASAAGRIASFLARRRDWGGDRHRLELHDADVALVRAVARANRRTIVVVIGGGTIVVEPWEHEVAAVLLAWYPGMEGGHALADVLLGDAEPGGRLPFVIPRRRDHLPTVDWNADEVTYGRWWGQRKLDLEGTVAHHPFGFGLGYTTFRIEELELRPPDGDRFSAAVTVGNTGDRAGHHVVQLYARLPDRPVRALIGFRSLHLRAGDRTRVEVEASLRPLRRWRDGGFVWPNGPVTVEAASFAGDPDALTAVLDCG